MKNNLFEFITTNMGGRIEADVTDKEINMCVCLVYDIKEKQDDFNKMIEVILKNVEVEEVNLNSDFPITANFYGFVEKNFEKMRKVFDLYWYGYERHKVNDEKDEMIINMVMYFENIISGNISEEFCKNFLKAFNNEKYYIVRRKNDILFIKTSDDTMWEKTFCKISYTKNINKWNYEANIFTDCVNEILHTNYVESDLLCIAPNQKQEYFKEEK